MQLRTSRKVYAGALVSGLTFVALATGAGEPPLPPRPLPQLAPVTPTVPAPVRPASHFVRYQDLLPVQGQDKNNKTDKSPPLSFIETGPELTLGECIAIAIERHPHLKAVMASTSASTTGYRSLINFGTLGTLISPDLEIRKQQAERGLAGAAGSYQKVHNELVQDATRLYYSAVFAKQQQRVADDVVERLEELVALIERILKEAKTPDELGGLTTEKLLVAKLGLLETKQLQATAVVGRQQAIAALRQVMTVEEATFPFRVKDLELPVMSQKVEISRKLVVDLALCRRPELALAAAGVDVFRLEVYAQGKIPFKRVVPTFASGADLHSRDIPQAMRGKEYRPGGIIPEMPTQLVGSKYDRVSRAMAFSQKADAVYENAVSLVVLEAENGFFEFQLANEKLRLAKEKYDIAVDLVKLARKNLPLAKTGKEQFVQMEIVAAKAQADYGEAVFQHLLALAALERITAGGIAPAFPGR
jgi:outer membrane protein TolC